MKFFQLQLNEIALFVRHLRCHFVDNLHQWQEASMATTPMWQAGSLDFIGTLS
ncbi:hypothetical protein [Burkholderia sp. NLJ2]|uniref:hypothetical protein n=1 Tax=Burkholderia sp. NLJ2 TaxID=3090699 RepID=UPI003C6C8999